MHHTCKQILWIFIPILATLLSAKAQDTTSNYISIGFYYAVQGHGLPTGTFTYNLVKPDDTPVSVNQQLSHKSKLLHGGYVQALGNFKKFGKKKLPHGLEIYAGIHMGYLRAQGSTFRSGRMDQIEFGIRPGTRYYVHKNVYIGAGLLLPVGANMLFIGDMDIEPISFGGEVVSGPVNVRMTTTILGTHPLFQIGYVAKNKGKTRIGLELGGGYLFWHTLRNRIYMSRRMNNIVNEDEQFWLRNYSFNGSQLNKRDFTRSSFQLHAGVRFMFK